MAFALPSFNAAVVSAQTSGLPLQRMQASIDFRDVNTNMATQSLGAIAMQNFAAEVGMAKQALAEYGGLKRNEMTLDYNREVLAQRKKEAEDAIKGQRRASLMNMLLEGGTGDLATTLGFGGNRDTRAQMQDQLIFESDLNQALRNDMGALDPSLGEAAAQKTYTKLTPQMQAGDSPLKKASEVIYGIPKQSLPKVELAQPTSQVTQNELIMKWLQGMKTKK